MTPETQAAIERLREMADTLEQQICETPPGHGVHASSTHRRNKQACESDVQVFRTAIAALEEREDCVAIPLTDAAMLRRCFLPANPDKLRACDPAVKDMAQRVVALIEAACSKNGDRP